MAQTAFEPFPPVNPTQHFMRRESHSSRQHSLSTRRRRRSSNLGDDPHGDTETIALATFDDHSPPTSPPVSRSPSERTSRPSKRRKANTLFKRWARFVFKQHTWISPLVICLIVVLAYAVNPTPSNPLSAALFLSYRLPQDSGHGLPPPPADGPFSTFLAQFTDSEVQYGKGRRDFAFVAFYTVFLSFTREFFMQVIIRPVAVWLQIKPRAKQARFMEQSYTAIYYIVFGPYGVWVMSRTPIWYFQTAAFYEGFPHMTHDAAFKAYYLLQASFWAQQLLVMVLMLEKPRKDFKELMLHHAITTSLIWLSYRFHFTYIGLAVYITHDISDFFLASSKMLNYLNSSFVGPYFGFFIGVWLYARHYINLKILYSVLTQFSTIGPFEVNWETQQYKCRLSQVITFSLLAALQSVNVFWLLLILRIAWRFVRSWGDVAEDERSEYEDSEAEDEAQGGKQEGHMNGKTTPAVLVNGMPVDGEAASSARANGSVDRRRG